MTQMSYCAIWRDGGKVVARPCDSEEEAEAVAREKGGIVDSWPTINSGTIKIYGLDDPEPQTP